MRADLIKSWLSSEGYKYDVDSEGDVHFKYQVTWETKVVKAFIRNNIVHLSIEMFIDRTPDLGDFMERCCDLLLHAQKKVYKDIAY